MAEDKENRSTSEAWQEVGQQFQAFGESLAAAFKAVYQNKETHQNLTEIQASLEAIAAEIKQVTQNIAASSEMQQVKVEVEKAALSAKSASKQAAEEWRPHLLAALNKAKVELDQLIHRMEQAETARKTSTDEPE